MAREYITSQAELPEDSDEVITLQVTDAETKEIFRTEARVARSAARLSDPVSLTVVSGPHENQREQWYAEFLSEREVGPIDDRLLRQCARETQSTTDVVNTRSSDLKTLLAYLVETGEYESTSEATRALLMDQFAAEYPTLVESYLEVKSEFDRDELADALSSGRR
ncbi:ubiD operon protein [Natronobeatus ordinarius]|uniref:ubiD operon protein n=1 Tax=Natronobeatus ordinarius TaxID=2963433 RepID=UPI0020CF4EB4|nr:ubiD operon protein [Natronobeatus ordinarius]